MTGTTTPTDPDDSEEPPKKKQRAKTSIEVTSPRCVDIDAQGDIVLELRTATHISRLKASSSVICNASSVFRAMLGTNSQFKEAVDLRQSRQGELYTLTLEDDNPEAMEIILNYLHHNNYLVPKDVYWLLLVAIATLTDKYDLLEALWLVKDVWTAPWEPAAVNPGGEPWLFMAHVFKKEDIFNQVSERWIRAGEITELGGPLKFETKLLNIPDSIISTIRDRRAATITRILEICSAYLEKYTTGDFSKIKCKSGSSDCDNALTGALLRHFGQLGLLPDPKESVSAHMMSVEELVSRINGLSNVNVLVAKMTPCNPRNANPARCHTHKGDASSCPPTNHWEKCGFHVGLTKSVQTVLDAVKGLDLDGD